LYLYHGAQIFISVIDVLPNIRVDLYLDVVVCQIALAKYMSAMMMAVDGNDGMMF
jgi:hypothetical protein